MTINVIKLSLDAYSWFSLPTQLSLDSFDSESSQIWLTTHESSTTLLGNRCAIVNISYLLSLKVIRDVHRLRDTEKGHYLKS